MKRDFASISGSSTPSSSYLSETRKMAPSESHLKIGTKSAALVELLQWRERAGLSHYLNEGRNVQLQLDSNTSKSQRKEMLRQIFSRGILPEFISISKQIENLGGIERPEDFCSSVLLPNVQALKSPSHTILVKLYG